MRRNACESSALPANSSTPHSSGCSQASLAADATNATHQAGSNSWSRSDAKVAGVQERAGGLRARAPVCGRCAALAQRGFEGSAFAEGAVALGAGRLPLCAHRGLMGRLGLEQKRLRNDGGGDAMKMRRMMLLLMMMDDRCEVRDDDDG